MTHSITTEGPIAYPGGKNGWHIARCSCDPKRVWWGHNAAAARKPADAHKRDKEAADSRETEEPCE